MGIMGNWKSKQPAKGRKAKSPAGDLCSQKSAKNLGLHNKQLYDSDDVKNLHSQQVTDVKSHQELSSLDVNVAQEDQVSYNKGGPSDFGCSDDQGKVNRQALSERGKVKESGSLPSSAIAEPLTIDHLKEQTHVTNEQLDQECTGKDLDEISHQIGNYTLYTTPLGLTPAEVSNIRENSRWPDYHQKTREVLRMWKSNTAAPTYRCLVTVALKVGDGGVARKLCEKCASLVIRSKVSCETSKELLLPTNPQSAPGDEKYLHSFPTGESDVLPPKVDLVTFNSPRTATGESSLLPPEPSSVDIFNEAMKAGYVKVSNTNVLILGMGGAEKISTKHMIFGLLPPEVRNPPFVETPVQVRIHEVSKVRIEAGEVQWKLIETKDLQQIVSKAVSSIACNLKNAPSTTKQQLQKIVAAATAAYSTDARALSNAATAQTSQSATSAEQSQATANTSSGASPTSQQSTTGPQASAPPQIQAYIASIQGEIVSSLEKENADTPSEADASKVLGSNWIYFVDSRGLPHFHNLLPHFVQGISIAFFTCNKLDDHLLVEGQSVGVPYRYSLTIEDTIKCVISSMQSHTRKDKKPLLVFIGSETLVETNAKLLKLVDPEYLDQSVFHDEALKQLIFTVDDKNPGEQEEKIRLIRSMIRLAPPQDVPVWWYVLEVTLENMSAFLGRKVLSKQECLEVARNLNFDERALEAALNFLHEKHLLHYYPDVLPDVVFASPQVLLDKLTELVEEAYQLRESLANPSSASISHCQTSATRSGGWRQFRDEGIVTVTFLEQFKQHYVDRLFTASDLLKIFMKLLVLTPVSASLHKQVDFTSPGTQFFMPSLLDMLPSADLEKYRIASSVEPLVIFFPSGSPRYGVFCCLRVYLIKKLKWSLVYTDGKPDVTAQNCVKLSHPREPCIITLIDSFSYLEVHIDAELSVCREVCPSICEDILKGIQASNRALSYRSEQPQLAFFCQCSQALSSPSAEAAAPSSSGASVSSPSSRHIAHMLKSRGWIQCSVRQREFSEVTEKHGIWLEVSSTVDSPATILNVDTHLWPVWTAVYEAKGQWKSIGRALRVPETAIGAIHDSDDGECLYQVLLVWMESGNRRAVMYDLLKALEHKKVGCTDIANEIRSLEGEDRVEVGL